MPGFGQPYPAADIPPPPDRDFGPAGGEPGGAELGGAGGGFGGGEFGSHGGFGPPDQQFAPGPEPGFGHPDPWRPYQDDIQPPGQPFGGTAEPDYGQATESFRPGDGGFGAPGFQHGAAAGMPPAPPDVPVPPGVPVPPPAGEPVHMEAQPSDLAGLRDQPFPSAAGSGEPPTLVGGGPATGARSGAGPGRAARTARMPRPQVRAPGWEGPHGRQAHVTLSRVEPWSVMKFSFVVSVVAFIVLFVAVAVLYGILAGLGVFDSLQRTIESLTSGQGSGGVNVAQWFSASRILGYAALIGAMNIILITALSTVGAVLYNAAAHLIGGVEVTLNEAE